MKKIKFAFLVMMLLIISVGITSATKTCINSSYVSTEYTINIDGTPLVVSSTDYCEGGCVKGECKPLESNDTIGFAIMFASVVLGFVYIGMNLRDEQRILGWIFIPMALIMMFTGFFIMIEFGAYSESVVNILGMVGFVLILILFLIIFYFIMMFLMKVFNKSFPYSDRLRR